MITKMFDAKIFVFRERHGASPRKCTRIKVQRGLLTLALSEKFAGLYLPRAARFDPVFPTFHNIVRNEVTLNPNNIMRTERTKKPIIKYSLLFNVI